MAVGTCNAHALAAVWSAVLLAIGLDSLHSGDLFNHRPIFRRVECDPIALRNDFVEIGRPTAVAVHTGCGLPAKFRKAMRIQEVFIVSRGVHLVDLNPKMPALLVCVNAKRIASPKKCELWIANEFAVSIVPAELCVAGGVFFHSEIHVEILWKILPPMVKSWVRIAKLHDMF